jgi:hypothetical protein
MGDWRKMNPATIVKGIILKLNDRDPRSSIYLSIPTDLSEFRWDDHNFENMIEKFLDHVLRNSHPDSYVRVAVHKMKQKTDLEEFFSIRPEYWLRLRVESQAKTGFESGAQKILEGLGYKCSEWIGVEDSESQLGAFHFGTEDRTALILFAQNQGSRRICDFLIPVSDSVPLLAQANHSCK